MESDYLGKGRGVLSEIPSVGSCALVREREGKAAHVTCLALVASCIAGFAGAGWRSLHPRGVANPKGEALPWGPMQDFGWMIFE